jgi:hypothetical protein
MLIRRLVGSRGGLALSSVTAFVVGVLATIHPGVPTADVSLNDGGVWVTNEHLRLVAHLNFPSRTLDGGLRAPSERFDVTQEAGDVLVHDNAGHNVYPIDVSLLTTGSPIKNDGRSIIHSGRSAAIVDPAAGKIWAGPVTDIGAISPEVTPPTLEGINGAIAAIGFDGSLHALSQSGVLTTVRREGDGWGKPSQRTLAGLDTFEGVVLSTVGSEPVVLSRAKKTLYLPGGEVTLDDLSEAALQQPGPAADTVALETPAALVHVPLRGGEPIRKPSGSANRGTPVAPVVRAGCVYAAWSVTGQYVRDCVGEGDDVTRSVDKLRTSQALVFRSNRDVVVINDTANGDVFLASDQIQLVDNWQDILTALQSKEQKDDKNTETTQDEAAPDRTDTNHKPTAEDDSFGARPGRTTTLPVLQNDTDPDGDILTAVAEKDPSVGTIRQVRSGAALQIAVPENATGAGSFTYQAQDGRGESDTASVSVTVRPWDVNAGPEQWRPQSSVTVVRGGEAQKDVHPDWRDPDGDPFYIVSVQAPEGMTAKYREDGLITVRDLGVNPPGRYAVKVVMGDGRAQTEGVLNVDVRERGAIPPVANADYVRVVKGQQVTVWPLKNDTDPNGDELRLASVENIPAGATVTTDLQSGTFRFTSNTPGTVYLSYVVSDGPSAVKGVVRIDVVEAVPDAPPQADDDLALLPAGGHVLVAVLQNDFDPTGGVLVVQSASFKPETGLSVEVVNREMLRISAPSGLKQQETVTYTISNGFGTASATVTVIPLAPVPTSNPPIANDDSATVRAGDIVTVHVLDNDLSPSGLPFSIDPQLQFSGSANQGEFFVSQDTIRFKAGSEPGTVRAVYTIRDTQGNYDSAEVAISIRAADGSNGAPTAPNLVARVLAGSSVRIPVVLDGIDPDGDSVVLLGLDTAPSKGNVSVGPSWLEYKAPADTAGSDTFTYAVMDRFGARSVGRVQVGIAPPSPVNQSPVPVPDTVIARPGRLLSVAVTGNDIDPDGDRIELVNGSVVGVGAASGITATTVGSRVTLTSPDAPGVYPFTYGITDGKGGTATGQLTLDIRTDTPLQPPVARDDVVQGPEVAGKTSVEVDVLVNDEDPDGAAEALVVTAEGEGVSVNKGIVTVALTPARRVIVYTIKDVDGLTAKAVIVVPGTQDRLPTLKPDKVPAKVKAGDLLAIPLAEYVSVRDGHTPILTFEDRVKAGPGADGAALVKSQTLLNFRTPAEFSGDSSITFEVTDGTAADDPAGLKAVLTLPIIVESSGKTRPSFNAAKVDVAAVEPTKEVDLRAMVRDPDEGDLDRMSFTLDKRVAGFDVSVDGQRLKVSVPPETKIGTTAIAELTITDGSTTPVKGQVPITAIASTRPRITTKEVVITTAKAGQPENINLTPYITNPFADLGKPVTMVGNPSVVVGSGSATKASDTAVVVTPATGFHGQLTVIYKLADATGQPDRQAEGRISLTVRDRPEPPVGVSAVTSESRTATVSWSAGPNNGAPITKFSVSWSGGKKDCGAVTTCTITGLTNNVEYTFTVVATNEVGDSDPSAASNMVRPDVRPNPPAAPTVKFGDKQIEVTWVTPSTEGSPVEGFTLEIDGPTGGVTQQRLGLVNSYVWTGLTNGASYRFRVMAHSKAEQPSEFSGYSATEIPAGLPLNLTAPKVVKDPVSVLPPSATLSWVVPNGNGDNAMTYELRRTGNAVVVYTGTSPGTRLTLNVDTSDQTFEYRAKNKAGWSGWSPASTAVRGFQTPGAVGSVTAEATGVNNQVKVTFPPANGNGARPEEMVYVWTAAGGSGIVTSGGTITYGGLANGANHSVSIAARSTVKGETVTGPATASNVVMPFGPPGAPQVSASGGYQQVTVSWGNANVSNGRNATIQISINNGGWENVGGGGGSRVVGVGAGGGVSIRARGVYGADGLNLVGAEAFAGANAWPDSSYNVTLGASVTLTSPAFCANGCYYQDIYLRNYRPNSNVYCFVNGVGTADWYGTFTVDGAGNRDVISASGPPGRLLADDASWVGVDYCRQQ